MKPNELPSPISSQLLKEILDKITPGENLTVQQYKRLLDSNDVKLHTQIVSDSKTADQFCQKFMPDIEKLVK